MTALWPKIHLSEEDCHFTLSFHTQHSSLYGGQTVICVYIYCWSIHLSAHAPTNTHCHIPLTTLAYRQQAWAAKTFSDHPSTPLSLPRIHTHTHTQPLKVCVCACDRYSLSVRVAAKCSDISRLCSPGFVIPPVPLSLPSLPFPLPVDRRITSHHV